MGIRLRKKGQERWPGEYPSELTECLKAVQYSSASGHKGEKTGMYHFYMGSGQGALIYYRLGDTSLVNENVALEADPRVWKMSAWPKEILDDFDSIKKDRINNVGVKQQRSTLTGNDSTGVNDGSKTTTLMNYIPDAWNHGCEIFCKIDIKLLKQDKKSKKMGRVLRMKGREAFTDDSHNLLSFVTYTMSSTSEIDLSNESSCNLLRKAPLKQLTISRISMNIEIISKFKQKIQTVKIS
ncbi:104_t:CDS:2 [Cetraspora pellucida]|uniref:104_t:CDS:1 n=1 Tax=Cetraspora pellucida TaxID=1433469 RepID=A0ACA9K7S1_9GLOM|nr:104_t:CDS:2 [Cetraspora pellucida]